MRAFAWTIVGFVVGVIATVAIVFFPYGWPSEFEERHTGQQMLPQGPSAQSREPEVMSNDPLGDLDVTARVAIMRWMAAHPQYEFITRDYCGCHDIPISNCPPYDADRAQRLADYPYADALDFNGDGQKDFAVMLGLKGKEGPQALFIFNGPFGDDVPTPVLVGEGWERRDRLSGDYVGHAESDNGFRITPKGATYELVYTGAPG